MLRSTYCSQRFYLEHHGNVVGQLSRLNPIGGHEQFILQFRGRIPISKTNDRSVSSASESQSAFKESHLLIVTSNRDRRQMEIYDRSIPSEITFASLNQKLALSLSLSCNVCLSSQ